DGHVTGVQTCALPILLPKKHWRSSSMTPAPLRRAAARAVVSGRRGGGCGDGPGAAASPAPRPPPHTKPARTTEHGGAGAHNRARSEERRVGKGWESRG